MGRGTKGDPKRKKQGGRYTPPARAATPDRPVRTQPAADMAPTAPRQAAHASHNSSDIPPLERLPQADQAFLRALSARVRRVESTTAEGPSPKEDAFLEAVSEVNDHILALRAQLDAGFQEPDPSDIGNTWAKSEPKRPSVKRVQGLAYNFFNLPGIKKVSLGIHIQKLVTGLPRFRRVISYSIPPCNDLSEHFSEVTKLMASTLLLSLEEARLEQYYKVGMVMGYRTAGMRWPVEAAMRHFAGQGVETFVEQLERVIRGALEDQVDPAERVRAELLDKEGTIYRLMRVSFDRVNEAVSDIEGMSIASARRILAENDYSTGACPALFPVDSVVEGEVGAKRPLAYEYGITIIEHIPPRLMQPAA